MYVQTTLVRLSKLCIYTCMSMYIYMYEYVCVYVHIYNKRNVRWRGDGGHKKNLKKEKDVG